MDHEQERALQAAAALLDVVYVLRLEPDMAFEYVSPSVVDLVGYSPEEHYADPQLGMRLIEPADLPVLMRSTTADLDEPVGFTLRWIARDGRVIWTEHRCRRVRRDDGSVVLYGAARDVTEVRSAQERLAETEHHYRLLAQNSSDLVFATGADGRLTWVGPSAHEVLGWSATDLVGRRLDSLARPVDRARLIASLAQGARGIACEARLRTAEGPYRWLSITSRPVEAEGAAVGRVGAARDIQDEHDARAAADEERALLRSTMDAMDDPHVLMRPVRDAGGEIVDFTIVSANRAAVVHTCAHGGSLAGARLLDVVPGHGPSGLLAMYARVVDTGESLHLDAMPYRDEMQGGEERLFDFRGVRVGDTLSLTFRDATERHLAQRALADSEERYRVLAENASDFVVVVDGAGVLTWISPSVTALLGWPPDEVVGLRPGTFIHPDDLPAVAAAIREVEQGRTAHVQVRIRLASDEHRWFAAVMKPVVGADGAVHGRVTAFHDVHDRVVAEQALGESEAMLRATLDSMLDPQIVVRAVRDAAGAVVDFSYVSVNPATADYLSLPAEALLATTLTRSFPGVVEHGLFAALVSALETGRPLVLDGWAYPNDVLGGIRNYDLRAVPLGDGLSITWRDVTVRTPSTVPVPGRSR